MNSIFTILSRSKYQFLTESEARQAANSSKASGTCAALFAATERRKLVNKLFFTKTRAVVPD
jgi:hypothetical protein